MHDETSNWFDTGKTTVYKGETFQCESCPGETDSGRIIAV